MPNPRRDANPAALRALGRSVKKIREEAGMTQTVLAEEVGMTRGSIANIERGSQNTTVATLIAIAMACETTLDHMVDQAAGMWR